MFSLTKAQLRYASAQHAALEEKSETLQLCLCARVTKRLIKKNIFCLFLYHFKFMGQVPYKQLLQLSTVLLSEPKSWKGQAESVFVPKVYRRQRSHYNTVLHITLQTFILSAYLADFYILPEKKNGSDAKYGNMLIHQRSSLQIRKSTL